MFVETSAQSPMNKNILGNGSFRIGCSIHNRFYGSYKPEKSLYPSTMRKMQNISHTIEIVWL